MFNIPESAILYADSARGIYIPQHFAESVNRDMLNNVSSDDLAILESGPDHSEYWDAWLDVCDNGILTDSNGIEYLIWQDGDLWLVPVGAFDEMLEQEES